MLLLAQTPLLFPCIPQETSCQLGANWHFCTSRGELQRSCTNTASGRRSAGSPFDLLAGPNSKGPRDLALRPPRGLQIEPKAAASSYSVGTWSSTPVTPPHCYPHVYAECIAMLRTLCAQTRADDCCFCCGSETHPADLAHEESLSGPKGSIVNSILSLTEEYVQCLQCIGGCARVRSGSSLIN
jgi:hypothetical protein